MRLRISIGDFFIALILILISLAAVLPFVYIVSVSFSSDKWLASHGATLWPGEFSLFAYEYVFRYGARIFQAFGNSVFITVAGTVIALAVSSAMAYPLSRKYLPYRRGLMIFVFITMLFAGGLIPYYLVIKNLHLIDSIWSVIIPGAINTWNMIILRNFFMEIPQEVEESALIDGANDIRILWSIILPMSKAALATIGLFYAVAFWNNWFGPLLFLNDNSLWPLMMFLKQVIQSPNAANEVVSHMNSSVPPSEAMKMAVVVVATLPILVVYPFLQRYFVKGMVVGSIKG